MPDSSKALLLQTYSSPITMLRVFFIEAMQRQLSGSFFEFHVNPAVGMTFPEIVADCRLVNELEVALSIILPFMSMTEEIGLRMLSFSKDS